MTLGRTSGLVPMWDIPIRGYGGGDALEAPVKDILETDARGRAVLSGHANELFLVRENSDGSVLLQPATVISKTQAQYDSDPELRAVLAAAVESGTVSRDRRRTK